MTQHEAKMMDELLDVLYNHCCNASCNDVDFSATDENIAIVAAAEKCNAEDVNVQDDKVLTTDITVLKYLRKRFQKDFGLEQ